MIIETIKAFDGQHCETTATGTLLYQLGIDLSEPMLFGLGEGLGFIFWNMKSMDFPFIGGRIKPDALTENIAKNLQLELIVGETASPKKAWEAVQKLLDRGEVVGIKLDCFYLEYFSRPFHFAGHYVALYGYDSDDAFVVDTRQQGGKVKTSLQSFALARAAKGPMSSKNRYYTLHRTNPDFDIKTALLMAIRHNAIEYTHPPISNIGYKGILKASSEIIAWFEKSTDVKSEFQTTAMLMERAGTGGALFRNLYRDFLKESYDLLGIEKLKIAYEAFVDIAALWTTVIDLFGKVTSKDDLIYIKQASVILKNISKKEQETMEMLATL